MNKISSQVFVRILYSASKLHIKLAVTINLVFAHIQVCEATICHSIRPAAGVQRVGSSAACCFCPPLAPPLLPLVPDRPLGSLLLPLPQFTCCCQAFSTALLSSAVLPLLFEMLVITNAWHKGIRRIENVGWKRSGGREEMGNEGRTVLRSWGRGWGLSAYNTRKKGSL